MKERYSAPNNEKAHGKDYLVLPTDAHFKNNETGQTIIRNQVIARIARLVVRDIEGVHKLAPYGANTSLANGTVRERGVQVEVNQTETRIKVRIITDYGASIPAIAEAIRENVQHSIHQMTRLSVAEINIDVVDLHFPEQEAQEERAHDTILPE